MKKKQTQTQTQTQTTLTITAKAPTKTTAMTIDKLGAWCQALLAMGFVASTRAYKDATKQAFYLRASNLRVFKIEGGRLYLNTLQGGSEVDKYLPLPTNPEKMPAAVLKLARDNRAALVELLNRRGLATADVKTVETLLGTRINLR